MEWMGIFECFVLVLLLLTGVWLTVRLDFMPFRHPVRMFRETVGSVCRTSKKEDRFSAFEAAATSLAGTMGTGNIAGVAAALALGGPGSVFWMVAGACAGMCTKYAEILLGIRFRRMGADGEYRGGPMYYLSEGAGMSGLAKLFAVLCALSAFGIGNMTQVNAAAAALTAETPGSPGWMTGAVMAAACLFLVSGGMKRLGKAMAILMPVLSLGYLGGCAWVIWLCRPDLPAVLREILSDAFGTRAVAGGALGYGVMHAMRYGLARGVFSHEAGLGSAPIAHAGADCETPHQQGIWGVFEVFWDTVVGCTATALVLLLAMRRPEWQCADPTGRDWVAYTFSLWFGEAGRLFVSGSLLLFAAAAMASWWLYGDRAVEYLTRGNRFAGKLYLAAYLGIAIIAAVIPGESVWALADFLNCCMVLPNLVGIIRLFSQRGDPYRQQKSGR